MSAYGVSVMAVVCPEIGTRIELTILLPEMDGVSVELRSLGDAQVLRVMHGGTTSTNSFVTSAQFCIEALDGAVRSQQENWGPRYVE
jgi:hypothetical protein